MRKSKQSDYFNYELEFLYCSHAFFDGLLVESDEVCITCRDALCKSLVDVLRLDDRLHLEVRKIGRASCRERV